MERNSKWLKLQLKDDKHMNSRYIILHTHFSIYSHLAEQGYEVMCYEATNHQRYEANAVLYICTDHEGFYKSCCQYYAHDFEISSLNESFLPPSNYRVVLGIEPLSTSLAS